MAFHIKKRKKLLRKALVALSLFALGFFVLTLSAFLVRNFFPQATAHEPFLTISLMALLAILTLKPLDKIYSQIFDRYLFKKKSSE